MSALTEPIATAVTRWAADQRTPSIGRLDLRRLPVPETDREGFCEALRVQLGLAPLNVQVDKRSVRVWVNRTLAVVVASSEVAERDPKDAWFSTQDFAIRLRDLHSDDTSPLAKLHLLLLLDGEMESLTSTSIDLGKRDDLRPAKLVASTIPAEHEALHDLLRLEPVAASLEQVLRTTDGNTKVSSKLDAWKAQGLPPPEAFLSELLAWFPDPELVALVEAGNLPRATERAATNKQNADQAARLQDRGADAAEWSEAFPSVPQSKIPALMRDGAGTLELGELLKQPKTPRFEGFRFKKTQALNVEPRTRNEHHFLACQGKGFAVTVEYSQAATSSFRVQVDGVPLPTAEAKAIVEPGGKDIRIRIPDNSGTDYRHYVVEIYHGRPTTRGRPSQTVRALVTPARVPELILESFQVGDVHRRGLVLSVAPPTTIQTPTRRITRTRPATPAVDDAPVWPLPCRLENGPAELKVWKFEDDAGTFDLPISCEDSPETIEPPPFYGALLDPSLKEPRPGFWTLEAEGRGIQDPSHQVRKALNVNAQDDLRKERLWTEGVWLSAVEDGRREWQEVPVPGTIASQQEVSRIRSEYKRMFAWLNQNGTVPSLVEAWAIDYWKVVDDVLAAVRSCITSIAPGQQNRLAWIAYLGTLKDTNGVLIRTSPFWPPALAAAATVARRLREGKLSYSTGLLQALSPSSVVPVNLAAVGVGRLSLARRHTIWTWADWIPVDRHADSAHVGVGRVFRNTLDRFIDSFHQLSGSDVPAPIRIRFIHVLPDQALVDSIEKFISDGLGRGAWSLEKTLELEFILDEPDQATPLDGRLDPGQEDVTDASGMDPFRACVRVAKLHSSTLQNRPTSWDPYVHITFIGSVTQYAPGFSDALTVESSSIDEGLLPSRPVDLVMPNSGRPVSFGAGQAGLEQVSELQAFALSWNQAISIVAFGNPGTPRPVPTVTPQALHGRFPIDIGANSKWLVYLDPGVGLIPLSSPDFVGGEGTRRPVLVHFTTSAARGMPGYSDVTLTEHVEDMEASLGAVCTRFQARPASQLLPVLNSLNGSWLLRVVKAETRQGDAEAILATAAAAHDLLPKLRAQNPDHVWVVAGWEDFHWVTGAAGHERQDAVFVAPEGGSDDILAVGVKRTGGTSVVPVVVEVKLGSSSLPQGLIQVRKTVDAFEPALSAGDHGGGLLRAQFGQYILRAAERMAAHGLLPSQDAEFLQASQGSLRQGHYQVDTDHVESCGYLVHADPTRADTTVETQQGIKVLHIPFGTLASARPVENPAAMATARSARPESQSAVKVTPAPPPTQPIAPVMSAVSTPKQKAAKPPARLAETWAEKVLDHIPKVEMPGSAAADGRLLSIDRLLRDFKVEVEAPESEDVIPGPQAVAIHLRPGPGVSVGKIRSALESLQVAVGATQAISLSTSQKPGFVTLFVPQNNRTRIPFGAIIHSVPQGKDVGLPIPAGVGAANEMIWLDLRDTNHLLLAGATGSGKTVYLKGVLLSMLVRFSPTDLRLHLIDPKGLDFVDLAGAPHFVDEAAGTTSQAVAVLERVEQEIARRRTLLSKAKCANIFQYREKPRDEPLPFEVVVIDEYNQLRLTGEPKEAKRLESLVCQLAQIGRAYGIYLIVATQRPSVEVITGDIKANFPTRMSFRVASGTDSRVILDQEGAEALLPRGDGLIMDPSGRLLRFQAAAVDDADVQRALRAMSDAT